MLTQRRLGSGRELLSPHMVFPPSPDALRSERDRYRREPDRNFRLNLLAFPPTNPPKLAPLGPLAPQVTPSPRPQRPQKPPRRLEPLRSGPAVRPPPPTPEKTLVEPESRLCNHHAYQTRSNEHSPPGILRTRQGRRGPELLRPLKAREKPLLRRSQGVPSIGCPCCRKMRQLDVRSQK